jgi:hypothetical protein
MRRIEALRARQEGVRCLLRPILLGGWPAAQTEAQVPGVHNTVLGSGTRGRELQERVAPARSQKATNRALAHDLSIQQQRIR